MIYPGERHGVAARESRVLTAEQKPIAFIIRIYLKSLCRRLSGSSASILPNSAVIFDPVHYCRNV